MPTLSIRNVAGAAPEIRNARAPRSTFTRAILVGVVLVVSTDALSMKPDNITEAEMALIPAYCPDSNTFGYGGTADNQSPNAPKWVALMGKGFWAIHHYCWALINLSRIQKPTVSAMVKQSAREEALGDLGYVIQNSPPDFVLLPEIYTKMGQIQLDLKRDQDANNSFAKARALKPDYWPAYFHWAEYLRRAGQKAKARDLVEEGLSYSPGAKPLASLLTELGGDPSKIKPRAVAPISAAPNN